MKPAVDKGRSRFSGGESRAPKRFYDEDSTEDGPDRTDAFITAHMK
jgi:hypothetical protein